MLHTSQLPVLILDVEKRVSIFDEAQILADTCPFCVFFGKVVTTLQAFHDGFSWKSPTVTIKES
jgi:hypothetical protein